MQYTPRPHGRSYDGDAQLHVCTVISNPVRYASRYDLYHDFVKTSTAVQINGRPHVQHWTVEIAYGDRPFEVTDDSIHHLQLRTNSEVWHKENALNLLFAYVLANDPSAQYFAWIDADVTFANPDWACETLHQLQHYGVVQMFSHAHDVGPKFQPVGNVHNGFAWSYYNDPSPKPLGHGYGGYRNWHPGYAWAATREAIDHLGGLIDWAALGSGDTHMAMGLIGQVGSSAHPNLSGRYRRKLEIWQERAEAHVKRNIGYVDGLLLHHWHGRKRDRGYSDRWKILVDYAFDPDEDLKRDTQGLWQLTDRSFAMRDDIRSYFRARNEDSIDLE